MIYVVSDTHFWHTNIIKFCGRPFQDVQHMHKEIRSLWNDCVKKEDFVIHLGDCAFVSKWNKHHAKEYLSSLNGKVLIVPGNHDRRDALKVYEEIGWRIKITSFQVDDVLYSHYPLKAMGKVSNDNVKFNVHGHEHHFVPREDHWNACCDLRDWKPQHVSEIKFVDPEPLSAFLNQVWYELEHDD